MKRFLIPLAALLVGGAKPPACPDDMVPTGTGTCIDRYEWPNQKGVRPLLGASALTERRDASHDVMMDATTLCEAVGKRTCTRAEWVSACRGPDDAQYPYGAKYDPHACNTSKPYIATKDEGKIARRDEREMARLDQSDPAGANERCVSPMGAYDMIGNAEEWVRCDAGVAGWCLVGRFWSQPVSCSFSVTKHYPRWHYNETGFRCCGVMR